MDGGQGVAVNPKKPRSNPGNAKNIQGEWGKMEKDLQEILNTIITKIDEQGRETNEIKRVVLNLENNLTTRLESLFDGYKLTHEKQWEMERKIEQLEKRLEALEASTA